MSKSQQVDDQDVRPACPVSNQCRDKTFRIVSASVVSATFEPCGNSECFADGDPEPDEKVAVSHGRGTDSMHRPREP